MTAPTDIAGPAARRRAEGPQTADVLRFHCPRPAEPAPARDQRGRARTAGSAALAPTREDLRPEPPVRRLRAVQTPDESEEVRRLAATITLAAMEVLAGTRPVQQLAIWLHRDLLVPVQLRAELSRASTAARQEAAGAAGRRLALVHRAAVVKAARASLVGPGVYEAAVVVIDAARCRAVALRLEASDRGGWKVTALEIG
ncbi:Rv3235 family protein [Sinomonas mesophila]|uniref:Rv3235 family protein n=1 Tax=Sinomonas mesophila TaxID=1531955 RepID=UPI0009850B2E|nr:Rv3235 family protein [Sinomonas mesophila]